MDAVFNLSCSPRCKVARTSTLAAAEGVGYDDGKDRISALPDDLLYDIVSRLPIRDAVHTTTLSNRWRHIWSSAPLVLFDKDIDPEPKLVAAVDSVLVSHRGPFHSVDIALCDLKDHEPELSRWTRILADRGVQDLVFISPRMTVDIALPAAILRCDKLCRLHLGSWEFPGTTNLPNGVPNFPKLRELKIFGILMGDRDLDCMLSSSPALEKLALAMSYRPPKHVRLLGQNLKCVISYESIAVEITVIEAPCLERLLLWETYPYSEVDLSEDSHVGVRIVQGAPALKVLGYLDTRVHQLRFGDDDKVIKVLAAGPAGTNASPMCRVSSVEILAIKVNLNVFAEVRILSSLLRCFPRIEVLHIESAVSDESDEDHILEFYEELSPIECVQLFIKKVFLYKFQGHESEMAFLKYLVLRADQMQKLTLVLPYKELNSEDENKIMVLHGDLLDQEWASEACTVLLLGPARKPVFSFKTAFDLSIEDPFLLNDGEELFSDIKRREEYAN